jgi:hypothetical protein
MRGDFVGTNIFQELELHNPAIANAFSTLRVHGAAYTQTVKPKPFVTGTSRGDRSYNTAMISSSPAASVRSLAHLDTYSDQDTVAYYNPQAMLGEYKSTGPNARLSILAFVLLLVGIGLVAAVIGPRVFHFLVGHWQAILLPLGGICMGGGAVLLGSHAGASPMGSVIPPRTDTEDPLRELKDLSERTASRLRSAFRLQICAVLAVGVLFLVLILWSVVMVNQNRILYASAFGSGSIAMLILTQWKWQPFDRINQARQQADNADILATGLRLRMETISAIPDLAERSHAQWEAVEEYLKKT